MKIAITFGVKYGPDQTVHEVFPKITGDHFIVVEGDTYTEARQRAYTATGGRFAFDYIYEVDGVLDLDFQRQIKKYGYTEFAEGVFTK